MAKVWAAKVWAAVNGPRDYPFTEEVEGFWEDERTSLSAFTRGIYTRDEDECIIGNCGYGIPARLDHCHIIQKNDKDTVSTPFICFSDLSHIVEAPSTSKVHPDDKTDCVYLSAQWSLDMQITSRAVR